MHTVPTVSLSPKWTIFSAAILFRQRCCICARKHNRVKTSWHTCRTWFDELTSWQQRSETECQRFSGELASFGGDLHSLYQHVMHTGSHVEDKAASMAYNQAQEVFHAVFLTTKL